MHDVLCLVLVLDMVVEELQLPVHLLDVHLVHATSQVGGVVVHPLVPGHEGAVVDHELVVGGDLHLPAEAVVGDHSGFGDANSISSPA